jgi:hypothetical protein
MQTSHSSALEAGQVPGTASPRSAPAQADRIGAVPDPAGGPVRLGHVDGEAIAAGDRGSGPLEPRREAFVPSDRQPVGEPLGRAVHERGRHPGARFVAGRVAVPEDPLAVGADVAGDEADQLVGDLASLPGGQVPAMELIDAALRRDVDEPARGVPRPRREADDGRPVATLPDGSGRGGDDASACIVTGHAIVDHSGGRPFRPSDVGVLVGSSGTTTPRASVERRTVDVTRGHR